MESLQSLGESTTATLNHILLSILGQSSETILRAASHLGVAQTVTVLLRALPYHASKGFMVVPASITAKHFVNHDEVFKRGPQAPGIDDAVYEFATFANDHLLTARETFKTESKINFRDTREAMPVFLAAVSRIVPYPVTLILSH